MSNIGLDCSRLLLSSNSPTGANRIDSSSYSAYSAVFSKSSNSSGSNQTLTVGGGANGPIAYSASFMINQLLRQDPVEAQQQMMTTSNDLLSSPVSVDRGATSFEGPRQETANLWRFVAKQISNHCNLPEL